MSLIMFAACGGDDDTENCNDTLTLVGIASTTFAADQTTANCQAYKDSYANHIISCPTNEMFENELDSLNCLCFDPFQEVQSAANAYNQDPSMDNCQEYRAAIQTLITTSGGCDPNGVFQDTLADLNC